jgi:Ni/Fe-hydrogenase subunit HybB-like protein
MSDSAALPRERSVPFLKSISLPRVTFWRVVLAGIIGVGLYATFVRFTQGLGASTALSDTTPWGLWVGFDVLCGVGLAAGGFTITAAVYLFGLKHLRPIARPAILTAFLGYGLVSLGLIYDLGRPHHIWHPLIMWNPHSVMFEVAWCVMLYSTVLTLEFSPIVFERLGWKKPAKVIKKITIPLVVAGVLLSTMHQSSLGTVFLIVPTKLHALWYSSALPIFFFVSSISVGLAMVIFEATASQRFLGHAMRLPILRSLARACVVVLGVLLVMRLYDVVNRGAFPQIFAGGIEGPLFAAELLIGILVPIVLFSMRRILASRRGLFLAATCVVLGFVLNRMNVSVTAFEASTGVRYFPSWMEIAVTMMLVALGFIAFGLAAKHLPIFGPVKKPATSPSA